MKYTQEDLLRAQDVSAADWDEHDIAHVAQFIADVRAEERDRCENECKAYLGELDRVREEDERYAVRECIGRIRGLK